MDATADAIALLNRHTMQFVEINAIACKLLGYAREELLVLGPIDICIGTCDELILEYDALISGQVIAEKNSLLRRKDGTWIDAEIQRQAKQCGEDWIIVVLMRDISERRAAEDRIYRLAHYDPLNGLPNRTLFYGTLKRVLDQSAKAGWTVAVIFIDMDHFKNVNDTMGHALGDELLRQFSTRLTECIRLRDTVGRLGGDEVAVILVMPNAGQNVAT